MRWLSPPLLLCVLVTSCSPPIVKPGAFDHGVLQRRPLPATLIAPPSGDEREVRPSTAWMGQVDPGGPLTFAGYQKEDGAVQFCQVLRCDAKLDSLVLLPLGVGETPLDVLRSSSRRAELEADARRFAAGETTDLDLLRLSLAQALRENRLASPLPAPRHVFAVAMNFPSHLEHDLAIADAASRRETIRQARPRVFLKHPLTLPAGEVEDAAGDFSGIIGPFDPISYADEITLPAVAEGEPRTMTKARIDYEVEIGAVIGETLEWSDLEERSDDELRAAVVGFVLMSDTKARNPQAMGKILSQEKASDGRDDDPYRTGDKSLDRAFGLWDRTTCRWWSYAASWGNFTAVGPLFVAAPAQGFPPRAMIAARSYGEQSDRGQPLPQGRKEETLYLRQCSATSEEPGYADALIWNVPDILRSIVASDSALRFMEDPTPLEAGDIICLGTPGGTVITSRPQALFDFLDTVLFWMDPLDWHDLFFDKAGLYLHEGDEVFLWAEGLGFQRHRLSRHPVSDTARENNT